jgi:hypothetical protein
MPIELRRFHERSERFRWRIDMEMDRFSLSFGAKLSYIAVGTGHRGVAPHEMKLPVLEAFSSQIFEGVDKNIMLLVVAPRKEAPNGKNYISFAAQR